MNKRKITALLLAGLLMFAGGCGLVTIDEEKAAARDNAKVLAEYKDIDITKQAVKLKLNTILIPQGLSIEYYSESDDTETWENLRNSVLQEMAAELIALEKAVELGLDQLTEEEISDIDAQYESIKSTAESYVEFFSTEDSTEEDRKQLLEDYYNAMGYTSETCREQLEKEFIVQKVKDYYIKDISVTEEEVRSYYDTSLNAQINNVETNPEYVELQMTFGGVYYYPEGYMNVRHIFVRFDDETADALEAAYNEEDTTEYNKLLGEAKATISDKLDDIEARLEAGEDFAVLMDEYNEDATFSYEPQRTEGIVRGPYSQVDIPGYLDAMAALTSEGQYTEPLLTADGAYIIQCVKMLAGEVPFEDVKDSLTESMLANEQTAEWSSVTQEWVDAAVEDGTLKMYPDRY